MDEHRSMDELIEDLEERRRRVRVEMGGAERVRSLRERGILTARERIDLLLDEDSFREIGTLAVSWVPEDRASTPGDGRICGFGLVDGRPVAVEADDATVKGASSAVVNLRKMDRVYLQAVRAGNPLVYFGENRGGRLPETIGSEAICEVGHEAIAWLRRRRDIPVATVITGTSLGSSSLIAAASDLTVQVEGTTMSVVSPRIVEIATGESVTLEELGGPEVHARITGLVDLTAADVEEAVQMVRQWLSYLPSNIEQPPPLAPEAPPPGRALLSEMVPTQRRRGYDMRRVLTELVDGGEYLELKPKFGRSLTTVLARLGGMPVGIMASNPMFEAGSLTPAACDKGTRMLCLCDAFDLPVIILQDTPGFLVGRKVEHERFINKSTMFFEALVQASMPRLVVLVRKGYGAAFGSLGGAGTGSDLLVAWPSAEIGFMDPAVAVNALYGDELAELDAAERAARFQELTEGLRQGNDPYGPAGTMQIDEVIHPDETRSLLISELERHRASPPRPPEQRSLRNWPTSW